MGEPGRPGGVIGTRLAIPNAGVCAATQAPPRVQRRSQTNGNRTRRSKGHATTTVGAGSIEPEKLQMHGMQLVWKHYQDTQITAPSAKDLSRLSRKWHDLLMNANLLDSSDNSTGQGERNRLGRAEIISSRSLAQPVFIFVYLDIIFLYVLFISAYSDLYNFISHRCSVSLQHPILSFRSSCSILFLLHASRDHETKIPDIESC